MRRSGRYWAGSWRSAAAPGRRSLRGGAGAGGEGELLGPGRGGRVRVAVPDAGPARFVPVGLAGAAGGAAGPGPGVAAVRSGGSDRPGARVRRDGPAEGRGRDRVRGAAACRVHRARGELRDDRVRRVRDHIRAGLGGLRCVHARAVGEGPGAAPGRGHPRQAGARGQAAAGHRPAGAPAEGRPAGPVGSLRRSLWPQQRPARGVRGRGPALRRGHPPGFPRHPAVRRGDQGRRRRQGRGLRAALVRERVQGTPVRGLGPGRHRQPAARPADPPPALPAGQPGVLPVLGSGRPAWPR